ncbi:hypothetical protein PPL_03478 [Heterostelium album PN500]|uniref:Uncharacterized protein n=1 Tax=Heterostelium pallidum (strain ATCC 26659 / Pp 5 / PN500) TaxID=670386 RepID=D3B502_HETP5|nr:hypothetical protein PPL_03478 [Heterostelium album PN500]EFA84400.1 hypothetical protein PPL_03478 [Heterostelium album PN500]|eukprot:XP_020436514.1 hypothetical protein PPL_03478 [Heterostelium album PN500]
MRKQIKYGGRGGRATMRRGRRQPQKIELPIDTKLSKPLFTNLKHVFIVDLSSYTGLACNELLHQLLFGEILNVEDVKVVVVMKAKFAPRCQCGIGERNVDTAFYKNRFIVEGQGRIVLEPEKTISSKKYRDALVKYMCSIVSDPVAMVHVHSEDYIDASCKVYSLITPTSETNQLLSFFKIGFHFKSPIEQLEQQPQQQQQLTSSTSSFGGAQTARSTPSKTTKFGASASTPKKSLSSNSSIPIKKKVQVVDSGNNSRVGIVGNEADVDTVVEKVKLWLSKRIKNCTDIVNLPKTRGSLEAAIKSFCTLYKESDIQTILSILYDSGDINMCMVCQSCRPTNPGATTFYFTHKRVPEYLLEHCHSMMSMINTLFTKNKEQPIQLNTLTASAFKDKVFVNEQAVVDKLIQSEYLKIIVNSNDTTTLNDSGSRYGGYDYNQQQQQPQHKQKLEYTEISRQAENQIDSFMDKLAGLVVNDAEVPAAIIETGPLPTDDIPPVVEITEQPNISWDNNLSVFINNNNNNNNTPTKSPTTSKYKYFSNSPSRTPKKDFSFF